MKQQFIKWAFLVLCSASLRADYYEKLPSDYIVTYGETSSPVKVTYLFSIYCPSCLEFMKTEFPKIKEKYIDTGLLQWSWHPFPNPKKPLTYQAMICLGMLTPSQKRIFLENCAEYLNEKNMMLADSYFKKLMLFFGHAVSDLYSPDFLLKKHPKESASKFVSQKKEINIPSIEVNGEYISDFPSLTVIERAIESKINKEKV